MRTFVPLFALLSIAGGVALSAGACSSESASQLFGDAGSGTGSATSDAAGGGADTGGGGGGGGGGGKDRDGGGGTGGDDGGGSVTLEGGVPCVAGGIAEIEPNNDPTTANALPPNTTVCGQITDNGSLDVDDFKWILPATANTMNIAFNGNVSVTVFVSGQQVAVLTPNSNQSVPFEKNKEYVAEVQSFDGKPQDYRIRLNVN